jgi:hypothetical protein
MMRLLASAGARVPSSSGSKRKVAADHFREQNRRSNEFHVAYLEDAKIHHEPPPLYPLQLEELLPLFSDLHAEDG